MSVTHLSVGAQVAGAVHTADARPCSICPVGICEYWPEYDEEAVAAAVALRLQEGRRAVEAVAWEGERSDDLAAASAMRAELERMATLAERASDERWTRYMDELNQLAAANVIPVGAWEPLRTPEGIKPSPAETVLGTDRYRALTGRGMTVDYVEEHGWPEVLPPTPDEAAQIVKLYAEHVGAVDAWIEGRMARVARAGVRPIRLEGQDADKAAAVLDALLTEAEYDGTPLLLTNGVPGRIVDTREGPAFQPADPAVLALQLGKAGRLERFDARAKDWRECSLPGHVANMVLRETHRLEALDAIVSAPYLTAQGELVTEPGYRRGVLLRYVRGDDPAAWPAVPAEPTAADVEAAKAAWDDVLVDFRFAEPADRDNYMLEVLTIALRPLVAGPVPGFLHNGTGPGTGKGLLAELGHIATYGRRLPVGLALGDDEAETRKAVFARALDGQPVIFWDEVPDVLGGKTLAAVLTADKLTDRVLGVSRTAAVPARAIHVFAGNNIVVGGDLVRRLVPVHVTADEERPYLRSADAFRHPHLIHYVIERRRELYAALLTMARAWFAAGQPAAPINLGTFEEWARIVGGVAHHAGYTAALGNLERLHDGHESNLDADLLEALDRLTGGRPFHARGLLDDLDRLEAMQDACGSIREAVALARAVLDGLGLEGLDASEAAKRLGHRLRKIAGSWHAGRQVVKLGKGHGGRQEWRIRRREEAASS